MGDIKVTMDCGFGNLEIDLCYLGKSGLGAAIEVPNILRKKILKP